MGASVVDTLAPLLANASPGNFLQQRNLRQAQIGLTAAQAAQAQAEAAYHQQATQLGAQQTQEAALKNQMTQQSLNDQKTLMGVYAKHADSDWSDPDTRQTFEQDLIKGGISYPGLANFRNDQLAYQTKLTTSNKDQLDFLDKKNANISSMLDNYGDIPDAQKPQYWAQLYAPALKGLGLQVDPNQPPIGDTLNAINGRFQDRKALLDQQKTRAETAAKTVETAGGVIKNQQAQLELERFRELMANPASLDQLIETSIPADKYPQLHAATFAQAKAQTNIKGVNDVIEKNATIAREQEKTLAVELDPRVAALRKKQEEDRANYQNALQQGDTATAKYFESATDVHQTLAAARSIEHIVDLARGNPIAGNQLELIVPEFTAAMQGIKPRGMQLNENGFSSTWDRVMNEVQSAQPGKSSIGASTLNQIMPYIKTIANGAVQNHNATRETINQVYHKNFPAEPTPYQNTANPNTPTGTARKVGDTVTLKGGKTITIKHVYPDGSFD